MPEPLAPAIREHQQQVEDLAQMRPDQVMLRTLIERGWTIPGLCDLVIDGEPLPWAIRHELEWAVLRPEWIFARRTERASSRLEAAISKLDTTIDRLVGVLNAAQTAPPLQPDRVQPAAAGKGQTRRAPRP